MSTDMLLDQRREHEDWINDFINQIRENDETKKKKAIRELQKHLSHEVAEITEESREMFYDTATKKISNLTQANNQQDVKCGIMLMCILLDSNLTDAKAPAICARFINRLRNVHLNVYDLELLDLVACAIGKIAQNSGSSTPNFVEFEIRRAIELILNSSEQRQEIIKRHSAILNLRELANVSPSFFFKHVMLFFDSIFFAINEPKLREPAISALRAVLNVVVEREKLALLTLPASTKSINQIDIQIPRSFEICFKEVTRVFEEFRFGSLGKHPEDKIHAALLILNELLRCSQESLNLFKDSFSDEINFSDINTFDLSQYLFMHFDKPVVSCSIATTPTSTVTNPMLTSSASSTTLSRMTSEQLVEHSILSDSSYLSKLFRSNSSVAGKPLFRRDLNSVVNHHKENGKAPILSFLQRSAQPASSSLSCRRLVITNYDQICQHVRHLMTIKNSEAVNEVLLILLPALVQLAPELFCHQDGYVNDSIEFLVNMIKLPNLRSLAYISLGLFALSILSDDCNQDRNAPTKFDAYIETIIAQIRAAFNVKDSKKKNVQPDPAVFICIGFLAQAFGRKIEQDILALLPTMFKVGLTSPLAKSLYNVCKYIESLEARIHQDLLEMLNAIILNNQMGNTIDSDSRRISNASGNIECVDIATLQLALKVLGRFTFLPNVSMKFAKQCAFAYLTHENRAIRLEAVYTCCHLLKTNLKPSNLGNELIKAVLHRVLLVGITDLDKYVRYSVLSRLDESFDYFLAAQTANLSLLQMSVNDELFEIRELGICTIGRVCSLNPAYIMPFLRQQLLHYLNELENSGVAKNMEQSARMLGHILSATPRLIRPFTAPLIKVFLPKLSEPSQSVTAAVMSAIGEQAIVSGLEMRSYFDDLFPFLLEAVQDHTSFQKREIALWTMGRLIENCGFVIEPYWKYPTLLDNLLANLKSDSTKSSMMIRQETIRVLGLLGAVDPYRHKVNLGEIDLSGESLISCDPLAEQQVNFHEMLVVMNNFDDYYSGQAIEILMRVMKDPNLSAQHTMAVQAVAFIFSVIKARSAQYLPHILPPFINIIRSGEMKIKEFLLQQLGQIISIVRTQIRAYLDDIFKVLRELWNACTPSNPSMQITLFNVVDQIVLSLDGDFRNYVPHLIPHIMRVLHHDPSRNKEVTKKLLTALQNFGPNLEGYVSLFVPPIVKLFFVKETQENKNDIGVRILALRTISSFCDDLLLRDFSTLIVHNIIKVISEEGVPPKVVQTAMETLAKFAKEAGDRYKMYIPIVAKTLEKCKITNPQYEVLVRNLLSGVSLDDLKVGKSRRKRVQDFRKQQETASGDSKRASITFADLERQFRNESAMKISKEDWLEWLSKLNIYLIKESPSLSLRSCFPIAMSSSAVARELFNSAFLSFWYELSQDGQKRMVNLIETALQEQEIPEVTLILLNLAEFLERIDLTSSGCEIFDAKILATRALKCRSYAKALHYKEKQFGPEASTEVFGALISINNKLQADFAAYGVLNLALQKCKGIEREFEVKEKWFEKLGNWEAALNAYRQRCENAKDFESTVGQMRCLEELSEWDTLYRLAKDFFADASVGNRQHMARIAANASWNLNKWDDMVHYAEHISNDSFDSFFLRAVITIHQGHYSLAQFSIDKARQLIDSELSSMASESYNRAYQTMIQVQLFSELEEVIQYKLVPERRDMIKQKWWLRLQGVRRSVEDWQKILQVHSLVLTPKEDIRSWLKFTKLCDRFNRHDLTLKTIGRIFGGDPIRALRRSPSANNNLLAQPLLGEVSLRLIDHIWTKDFYKSAFVHLHQLIDVFEKSNIMSGAGGVATSYARYVPGSILETITSNDGQTSLHNIGVTPTNDVNTNQAIINKILSRAYFKLGDWSRFLFRFNTQGIKPILEFHRKATEYDANWYKAWHTWAFMNFRALKHLKAKNPELNVNLESQAHKDPKRNISLSAKEFCRSAVRGFFAGIKLAGQESSLQDTLRVLTLWFEDGHDDQVRMEVEAGIKNVSIETWLQVIPQLIARIDAGHPAVAKLIHQLLADIGKSHPQALIYPLTVASKSSTQARRKAATGILQLMRVHSPNLVKQAILVSEELIRIAILWHELWHEGLEEASRLYFGEKNIDGMLDTLEPLHQMITQAAITYKEVTFVQNYGVELDKAALLCKRFRQTKDIKLLNQAWDVYYHVFRKISRQLNQLTSLELNYVSPKLCECIDLELAVPGSYSPAQKDRVIKIARVENQLTIITSKQRPRKLTIKGSNGMNYMFLLKGHEDLRQDERVMQLFGLVNTLLNKNISTTNRNLSIQRYAVIPLSPNSGLIGWVPHCDTLHSLIRDYREKRVVLLNIEHRLMLRMAPDYDRLILMGKVEVFEHALDNTPGNDLAKIMWLKSPNSEVWFDRRTNYTRSLAVMSMVGYILGLGDRHPSNLMLDQKSGKILHIDFGDCFEVAMTRDKYPEKIPFRLTRMLVKAMEVAGVEGTFRVTAAQVMTVLRMNRESLMALLEAFVYDPLLNWRLQEIQNPREKALKLQTNHEPLQIDFDPEAGFEADKMMPAVGKTATNRQQGEAGSSNSKEGQNQKALEVIKRVRDKLNGKDFRKFDSTNPRIPVYDQVSMLIQQATAHENLCQCYIGWCPFW